MNVHEGYSGEGKGGLVKQLLLQKFVFFYLNRSGYVIRYIGFRRSLSLPAGPFFKFTVVIV